MSIFGRLGYDSANTSNVVTPLSNNAISTLSRMPPLLNDWQTEDSSNSDVGDYFVNPVANVTQDIWNTANTIITITGLQEALPDIYSTVNDLRSSCNNFIRHTNRISGVSSMLDEPLQPHYNTAIGISKIVMFIVFRSDGIQNNAPLMGNFTSLTINDTLTTMNTSISTYSANIANSISLSTFGTPPDEYTSYTSNLTPTQISTVTAGLNSIINVMDTRRTSDVNFYNNSRAIVNDYSTLNQFSNPGQSEKYLINNFIGTDKLKSRINS
jgi:hypothetical protein